MKTQRHEWVKLLLPSSSFFLFIFKASQSSWGKQAGTQRERHRERVSVIHSVLELFVGWVLLLLLFFFFLFWVWWNCPTSLFLSVWQWRSKQSRRKPGGSGVGREGKRGKGREGEGKRGEGREGKREGKGSVCQSENFWFLRGVSKLPPLSVYLSNFSGNCVQIVRVFTWGLESLECFFLGDFLGLLSFQRREFF